MQQLNENIKNHYKQRLFESLLNENIQVDEQVGRIVVRGLKALKGTLDPKYFTPTGKAKPFEYARRSFEVRRELDGTIKEIKDGDTWRPFLDWWQEHLRNLQIGGSKTWDAEMRNNQEYLELLKQMDPDLYNFYIKSHMYKNKVYQQVQRYLPANSRNFGLTAPLVIPGLTDTNQSDTFDPNDPTSGGWSFDPTTAPYTA